MTTVLILTVATAAEKLAMVEGLSGRNFPSWRPANLKFFIVKSAEFAFADHIGQS